MRELLIQAGFDLQIPTVWLLEGFLFYLPNENITRLIDRVTELSVSGSCMGFDIINRIMLTHPLTRNWVDMQAVSGAPWIGTLDDPISFLGVRGWQENLSQAGASDANYLPGYACQNLMVCNNLVRVEKHKESLFI